MRNWKRLKTCEFANNPDMPYELAESGRSFIASPRKMSCRRTARRSSAGAVRSWQDTKQALRLNAQEAKLNRRIYSYETRQYFPKMLL